MTDDKLRDVLNEASTRFRELQNGAQPDKAMAVEGPYGQWSVAHVPGVNKAAEASSTPLEKSSVCRFFHQ